MKVKKPIVGSVVHYYEGDPVPDIGPLAAIVCGIGINNDGDETVSLIVFDGNGVAEPRPNIPFSDKYDGCWWEWPPE